MSMSIPEKKATDKEFVLESTNSDSVQVDSEIGFLIIPSINGTKHRGDNAEDWVDRGLTNMSNMTYKLGLGGGLLMGLSQSALKGVEFGGIVVGLGIAASVLIQLVHNRFNRSDENDLMPSNLARLDESVYQAALNSGVMPNRFCDPISKDIIEIPVAFLDDPTATIYDMEALAEMKEYNDLKGIVTYNPLVRNLPLNFNNLVYLPEVKMQIEEIKTKWSL